MFHLTKEEAFKLELSYNDLIVKRCVPPPDKVTLWRCLPEGKDMYRDFISSKLNGSVINPHLFEAFWNHFILNVHDVRDSSIYGNLKDDRICAVCGTHKRITIDHKIPITLGGPNRVSNLQYLCSKHNKEKSNHVYGLKIFK